MKKTLLFKNSELFDLVCKNISTEIKVGTNVLKKVVEDEEITTDCLQIEVNSLTNEIKDDLNKITKNYKVEKIDNLSTFIFVEFTDLASFLSTVTNEEVIEVYSLFESNMDGEFEEYLSFEIK